MERSSRLRPLALAAAQMLVLAAMLASCSSSPVRQDLERLTREIGWLSEDARDLAGLFEPTDQDLALRLGELSGQLGEIHELLRLRLEGAPVDLEEPIRSLLDLLAALAPVVADDPEEQAAWNAYLTGAQIIARRLEAWIATPEARAIPE